ncbi:MAG: HPr kinase/phosphorylase [Spirochaetales bacterium]|nr:HPr kinase/phosphorylase [Leptospiraceae bacterium]MCP5480755.1 HPr kinase/phosphorylase [Spirochaetales bacterium]
MSYIEVGDLVSQNPELELVLRAGQGGLNRHLVSIDVNRPGLALAGFYRNFAADRIQVFGKGEYAYLVECGQEDQQRIIAEFFKYRFPGLLFTHNNTPPERFLEMAEETSTPVLTTRLSTHQLIVYFTHIMNEALAPSTSIHGVLIDVFGVGILLMGASGIGKSETALELVERGHRLVADDIVHIRCIDETDLIGITSDVIQHHMELRGLGIINVKDLFGVGAIRNRSRIDLVIRLEDWDENKEYERLGLEDEYVDILGVKVPRILLPVRPGRNVPILIETAAMNHRSKQMGFHAARELSGRINREIHRKNSRES